MDAAAACQLYLITPPAFDPDAFADVLAAALDAGPVACVQLRLKGPDGTPMARDAVARAADRLRPVVQGRDVALIMNDDPALARETGCDGVHVGQEDAAYAQARRAVGADAIVGVTCHDSTDLALEAAEAGADYVAFGAFHATGTKQPKTRAEPSILEWWSTMTTVPCVAIGGITVANAPPLVAAGADFLAVVAGVWDHPDGPAAAVRAFDDLFRRGG
ncbi:MAG: thiamine phosphate synthase [Hyphomicrobiales bacterium]|nr:thiamine phosphate synthase [Hyphomicrobiales bacterium]MCP5371667.1 thiamine phosphate synthase [Hyphomicrobiales bacterium]